jgi:hypothetical protein
MLESKERENAFELRVAAKRKLRLRDLLDSLPAHANVGDRRQCDPIGALKSAQIPANPPLAKVRTRIRIIEEKRSMRRL